MQANRKVFVYGSLLTGLGNHGLLRNSTLLGSTVITAPFSMISYGAFPALIPVEEEQEVIGEAYEVDGTTFEALDRLEGYPTFYNRVLVKTRDYGVCWVYFIGERNTRHHTFVPNNDWKAFLSKLGDKRVVA